VEAAVRPTEAWTLKANAGYLDAYYSSFCANFVATNATQPACGAQPGQVENTNLTPSNAPRWTLSMSADYGMRLGVGGALDFHIDEAYTSSLWTADDNNPVSYRVPQALLNAAIKWSGADGRFYVSVWGRNLTDKVVTEVGVLAYPLFSLWNPTAPRTFGLTAGVKIQ
jgi:iron complex outermembrane receptor protein